MSASATPPNADPSAIPPAVRPHFAHAVILGYGLIGASVAQALRAHSMAERIGAWDHDGESLALGLRDGTLQCGGSDLETLQAMLADADFVLFALPPQPILDIAQAVGHAIPEAALVMDVASVKQPIASGLRALLAHPHRYVPAHPIAGGAGSGAEQAQAMLFQRRAVMLSPEMGVEVGDPALLAARGLWEAFGAEVTLIPAEVHDGIYAYVSHLPQAIAFAAGHALLSRYPRESVAQGDILPRFLRLQASPAALWAGIFTLNAASFGSALETGIAFARHFLQELSEGQQKDSPAGEAPAENADAFEIATLFSRIAASCVVMSVFQLERNAKMKVARFAGSGFADVCAPAIESPEPEFERIGAAWKPISALLEQTIATLERMLQQLRMSQTALLEQTLAELQIDPCRPE